MGASLSREQRIDIFRHRGSGRILLFPWACVPPVQLPAGDAVALAAGSSPLVLGERVGELLAACRQLEITRRLGPPGFFCSRPRIPQASVDSSWGEPPGRLWRELCFEYPALTQGVAAVLRQFSATAVLDRENWTHRVIVRIDRGPHGDRPVEIGRRRQPKLARPHEIGELILEMLASARDRQRPAIFR
jgi:hypothetical protein